MMAKVLLIYLIIGCLLFGITLGWRLQKCPNDDELTNADALTFAATWPVIFGAVLTAPHDMPPRACKEK